MAALHHPVITFTFRFVVCLSLVFGVSSSAIKSSNFLQVAVPISAAPEPLGPAIVITPAGLASAVGDPHSGLAGLRERLQQSGQVVVLDSGDFARLSPKKEASAPGAAAELPSKREGRDPVITPEFCENFPTVKYCKENFATRRSLEQLKTFAKLLKEMEESDSDTNHVGSYGGDAAEKAVKVESSSGKKVIGIKGGKASRQTTTKDTVSKKASDKVASEPDAMMPEEAIETLKQEINDELSSVKSLLKKGENVQSSDMSPADVDSAIKFLEILSWRLKVLEHQAELIDFILQDKVGNGQKDVREEKQSQTKDEEELNTSDADEKLLKDDTMAVVDDLDLRALEDGTAQQRVLFPSSWWGQMDWVSWAMRWRRLSSEEISNGEGAADVSVDVIDSKKHKSMKLKAQEGGQDAEERKILTSNEASLLLYREMLAERDAVAELLKEGESLQQSRTSRLSDTISGSDLQHISKFMDILSWRSDILQHQIELITMLVESKQIGVQLRQLLQAGDSTHRSLFPSSWWGQMDWVSWAMRWRRLSAVKDQKVIATESPNKVLKSGTMSKKRSDEAVFLGTMKALAKYCTYKPEEWPCTSADVVEDILYGTSTFASSKGRAGPA